MFPEEKVRHSLITLMVNEYGYPKDLIVIEKEIGELPHLQTQAGFFPKRRLDILCYAKVKKNLIPLLLVECKVFSKDKQKAIRQVYGYNFHVNSLFLGVADINGFYLSWFDQQKRKIIVKEGVPFFSDLLEFAKVQIN
jgi:hypothetical protein